MSSFPETKAEKYVNKAKGKKFLQYNAARLLVVSYLSIKGMMG